MDDPALLDLLQQWFWARPIGIPWEPASHFITEVPASLAATITYHEPYRSQALQDALLWLQLPVLVGFGLEAIPVEPFVIRAVDHWKEAVSPLAVRLEWSLTMAGDEIDWTSDAIHCVTREAGQWRIVSLFSDAGRDDVRQLLSGT
jgi:hypothetical protein